MMAWLGAEMTCGAFACKHRVLAVILLVVADLCFVASVLKVQ